MINIFSNRANKKVGENGQNLDTTEVDMIEVHTPSFFSRHFLHILVLFGIGFLVFTYVFQIHYTPIYIVGQSMQPTINASAISIYDENHKDLVYYEKTNNFYAGDIVIADFSEYLPEDEVVIKRLVATPGQTIVFKKVGFSATTRDIYFNMWVEDSKGNIILKMYADADDPEGITYETYIKTADHYALQYSYVQYYYEHSDTEYYAFYVDLYNDVMLKGEYSYTLQSDEYFLMGDNRNGSTDSRMVGPIKRSHLLGKMAIHIPYGTNFFVGIWNSWFSSKWLTA